MKLITGALVMSVGFHIFGASIGQDQAAVTVEGGDVAGDIALGFGFADLVTGVATGTAVVPDATETVAPQTTTPLVAPARTAPLVAPHTLPAIAPAQPMVTPSKIRATASAADPVVPTPERFVAKTPPAPKTSPAPKGNAKVSTAKGQASGAQTGQVAEASKDVAKSTAKTVGARAIKTYHASIHRKISRVPKRSAGAKGNAYVGITIAGSGAISAVQIVKSSGHRAIDELALAQIKRAGPFPPTPSGGVMRVQVMFSSKS